MASRLPRASRSQVAPRGRRQRSAMISRSLTALALLGLAGGAASLPQEPVLRVPARRAATRAAFDTWRQGAVGAWQVDIDPHTGRATFLGGGRLVLRSGPVAQAELEAVAREALFATRSLTAIDEGSLRLERTKYLPLGIIGSTDKWTLRFRQEHGDLPVRGATVNVLIDLEGAVLSIQSTALEGLADLPQGASLSAQRATALARAAFEDELGVTPTSVQEPVLVVGGVLMGEERQARLVWEVEAEWRAPGLVPEGRRLWIDATLGETLRSQATVHTFDVSGTVHTNATPGVAPDTALNPPVNVPVKDMRIKSPAGNVISDASGNWTIPGATGPLQVTAEFVGPWAHVDNDAGVEEVSIQQLSGAGNAIQLNPSPLDPITSQANAFLAIGVLRDWVRAVDPTDDTADFQAYARVNLASACNAYFDGFSVNFFAPGSIGSVNCINTGYSTVVAHEMGHWLNVLYGTGNGTDGMGEGNADVFAMYLYDTPVVGVDFLGAGTNVRSGLNSVNFCGDCCPGCHGGEVHLEGEPWMGAAWKLRDKLNQTHGNTAGDLIADGLFSGWMNGYDQTQIRSVIELQWLALDDDNGDLADGTPHYADIDFGFRAQGFPGFDPPAILFRDVTVLESTTDEVGPYPISAKILAQAAPSITGASITFRVNEGAWTSFGMVPFGIDTYQVDLPGQSSIAFVDYYLTAVDSSGTTSFYPEGGVLEPIRFIVGSLNVLFEEDFEGPDDGGWTHGTFGDTSNPHDDFQRGAPAGLAGDPGAAFSGAAVFGNDIGQGVWNGAYQNGQHNWLRSPVIDCSAATNTQLRFRRWLNLDPASSDHARLLVNGVEVYASDPQNPPQDGAWELVNLDVSAAADGQPAVQLEFQLESDASGAAGGWNIDDVELHYLTPSPGAVGVAYCFGDGSAAPCPCANGSVSGEGCANSTGAGAVLSGLGSASAGQDDLVLNASGLVAGQPALAFAGLNAVQSGNGATFGDGLRCAGGSIARLGVSAADGAGAASWGPGLGAAGGWSGGDMRRFQIWYRDPSGGPCATGFNLSNGLEVSFAQ